MSDRIAILHFNDVYNIEGFEREPVGGAARLAAKFKEFQEQNPLVVFSGDCMGPSIMSTVTKGKQMVPVLNEIGVHVAALGNHDLDHGLANFDKLRAMCKFPWLLSNVMDKETGIPLGNVEKNTVIEWQGLKLGFFGLAEEEWISTLSVVDPATLNYVDFVTAARQQVDLLKAQGVDAVIALTHMRLPNDEILAREVEGIDLILGGHDHDRAAAIVPPFNTPLIKSGCDFKEYTFLTLTLGERGADGRRGKATCDWQEGKITRDVPEEPALKQIVDQYNAVMGSKMGKEIGWTTVDLDGRFSQVRTCETNLGNLVCDVWRLATKADIAILNSGTLRSDMIHPAGPITMKDLLCILPMADSTAVLECSGEVVLAALENGVSQYPKVEGRFPQVSGIQFTFDPSKPGGQRVVAGSVMVGGEPLDQKKLYKVATKGYLTHGKDGYECFMGCKQVVPEELGPVLPSIMNNHFRTLKVLNALDSASTVEKVKHHWARFVRSRQADKNGTVAAATVDDSDTAAIPGQTKKQPKPLCTAYVPPLSSVCMRDERIGRYVVNPIVTGRINRVEA